MTTTPPDPSPPMPVSDESHAVSEVRCWRRDAYREWGNLRGDALRQYFAEVAASLGLRSLPCDREETAPKPDDRQRRAS
jgi:hypothetical protein